MPARNYTITYEMKHRITITYEMKHRITYEMKHVPEDGGTVRSSGYGLMVVKTTDSAADANLSGMPPLARKTTAAVPPNRRVKPTKCPASTKGNQRQAKPQTRGKEAATSCAQVVAAATATGSQSICGGLRAHLARSPCHRTPSRCLCPGNPSPGHTKRQITMIAGASREGNGLGVPCILGSRSFVLTKKAWVDFPPMKWRRPREMSTRTFSHGTAHPEQRGG